MPITRDPTSNSFTGTVGNTLEQDLEPGRSQGGFYGPPATTAPFAPPELGGSLLVGNQRHRTMSMVGSFALKK